MSARHAFRILTCLSIGLLALMMTACSSLIFDDKSITEPGVHFQSRFRSSLDTLFWDTQFSEAQRTVPVHAADGGAGKGGVKLNTEGASYGPRIGVLAAFGPNPFRIILGGDIRVHPMPDSDNFDDTDLHDRKLQPLGIGYDSYGYALFDPDDYSYVPYAGIESVIAGRVLLGLEFGRPHSKFSYERGHYRWHYRDRFYEAIERDSWRGFGHSGSIRIGYLFAEDFGYLGLHYSMERYKAEFSGIDNRIHAHVIGIMFGARF